MAHDQFSIAEAKNHLPRLVHRAESGTAVELTRHGRPVAVIVSRGEYDRLTSRRPSFGDALASFLQRWPPGEDGIDRRFFDSLRDSSPGREIRL